MSGKFVRIQFNVAVDEWCVTPYDIAKFLNDKLYTDPEFFGEITVDNIVNVSPFENASSGRTLQELMDGHTLE